MEMKSKIYKRWDSILGDLLAICNTEITTKFRKNWKNGQKSADHRRVHGPQVVFRVSFSFKTLQQAAP